MKQIYILCKNDYPDSAFKYEEVAKQILEEKNAVEKIKGDKGERRAFYHLHTLEIQQ